MAVASAQRLRQLDGSVESLNLNNEPSLWGPVINVQSGSSITGGAAEDEITFANLNDSGAGSARQAVADATTAGGGYITSSVSGTITLLSNLEILDVQNLTFDMRGVDIKFDGTRVIKIHDTAGNGGVKNLILQNFKLERTGVSGNDGIGCFFIEFYDASPWWFDHLELSGFTDPNSDESINRALEVPENLGVDHLTSWCRWAADTDKADLCAQGNAQTAANPTKFNQLHHHCFWAGGVNNRMPRLAVKDTLTAVGAYAATVNCFRTDWAVAGFQTVGGCQGCSQADTSSYSVGAGTGEERGAEGNTTNPLDDGDMRVIDPRQIGTTAPPFFTERNAGDVDQPSDRWASTVVCTPSAAHDTIIDERSGSTLQLTSAGTLDGADEESISGKTFILPLPSTQSWLAAGAPFNGKRAAMRGFVTVWEPSTGTLRSGTEVFTVDGDVARTDAQTVTMTASADVNLAADAVFFYVGDGTEVTSGDPLQTWNYADVTVVIPSVPAGQVVVLQ